MPSMNERSIPPRAVALLALLTFVWGTNWPLFPVVLAEMSVWDFRIISLTAGGLLLLGWARAKGMSLAVPRKHWWMLGGAAVTYLAVWNVASAYATTLIPSGQTAVLGFTMPLWLALLAWVFQGQRLSPRLLLALGLGGTAVALLMVPSFKAYANAPLGMALGLLAGIGWAVGTLLIKRWPIPVHAAVSTGWQLLLTAVVILVIACFVGQPFASRPSAKVWWLVAYITLVPMAIGNVTWYTIVELLPAQVAGLSSILVPVVAMVAGSFVHGEPLGAMQWAAMGCSAAALWLTLRR
jgi:drug/metabolite transporter (DMT)-like permease